MYLQFACKNRQLNWERYTENAPNLTILSSKIKIFSGKGNFRA